MKKIILTMAAVFAVSFANAQDKKGGSSDMKFGVKAGYLSSNFTGDFDGGDARSSFYIGGLVDFAVSEKFHVQPELLYSMEGSGETEENLDFIRIPVLAKYYVADSFSLQAGPQFGFVAGGGLVKDLTKSMDYGLAIGAGYPKNNEAQIIVPANGTAGTTQYRWYSAKTGGVLVGTSASTTWSTPSTASKISSPRSRVQM